MKKQLGLFLFCSVLSLESWSVDPYTIIVDQMNAAGTNYSVKQIPKPTAEGILRYDIPTNSPKWILKTDLTILSSQLSDSTPTGRNLITVSDLSAAKSLLQVPSAVSQLTNDSNYVTDTLLTSTLSAYPSSSSLTTTLANYPTTPELQTALLAKQNVFTGAASQYVRGDGSLNAFPAIPTLTSQLTNDSSFITSGAMSSALGSYSTTAAMNTALSDKMNIPAGTTSQVILGNGTVGSVPAHSQAISTITGLQSALDAKFTIPSGTTSQYVRGDGTLATMPSATTRTYSYPTRAVNTCFQLSSTQDAEVRYNVDISTTLSLTTGQRGTVYLRHYTNNTCTTGAQDVDVATNGNTGALTIGLNLTQIITGKLSGVIPGGKWVQIVTENTTSTPTFTARPGQEVLL